MKTVLISLFIVFFAMPLGVFAENINTDEINGYTPFAWSNNLTDYSSQLVSDAWHGALAQRFFFGGNPDSWIQVRKTFWKTFTRTNELSFWGKASLPSSVVEIQVIISVRKDNGSWYIIDTTNFNSISTEYILRNYDIPSNVPSQFNQIEFKFKLVRLSGSGPFNGNVTFDYMYSSAMGGIQWFETIDDFGDLARITNQNKIAENFQLFQNYPNPFNPATNIKFQIPNSTFVTLAVYDMLGKEIEILVDEKLNAGTYKVDWNASNFSSGTYFYRLTAGEFTETKKMILLR